MRAPMGLQWGGKWGENNLGDFFLISYCILGRVLGFILFQNGELRAPDLVQYFLDDLGNFENLVKILTRNPPNCYQRALQNTRKIWNHLGKILFMSIWDSKSFEKKSRIVCPGYQILSISFSFFRRSWDFEYIFQK